MGKKILLADDSITIQKVIELTFSDEDFEVVTVGNGRLALERLPQVRPDIVLCDIIMPEKDGYEVCEQVKANPSFAHIPVLLLTGAFEPFDQERAARAGYDGSLAKPFEPETLIAKVRDLLSRAPLRASSRPPVTAEPAPEPRPAAPLSTVVPFQRPSPEPPPASSPPSFIPDEPFGDLEGSAFSEPAPVEAPSAFAPMTEEESATLLAPPAPPSPEDGPADAAATVMFRADDLPWNAPPPPAAPVAAPPVSPAEPTFVPEPPTEVADETPVFEEVLEEDLDFGTSGFPEDVEPGVPAAETTLGGGTLPPVPPEEPSVAVSRTEAFSPVGETVFAEEDEAPAPPELAAEADTPFEPAAASEPEAIFEPDEEAVLEEEAEAEAVFEVERTAPPERSTPPEREPEQEFEPDFEPEPAGPAEPEAPFEPAPAPEPPPPAPAVPPESFADVATAVAEPEPPAPPPSEAAAFSVPVEMVEKIAQRVVAQISEKAVREIAWEVIPELAEALIKQEIERLKAELQKV